MSIRARGSGKMGGGSGEGEGRVVLRGRRAFDGFFAFGRKFIECAVFAGLSGCSASVVRGARYARWWERK